MDGQLPVNFGHLATSQKVEQTTILGHVVTFPERLAAVRAYTHMLRFKRLLNINQRLLYLVND